MGMMLRVPRLLAPMDSEESQGDVLGEDRRALGAGGGGTVPRLRRSITGVDELDLRRTRRELGDVVDVQLHRRAGGVDDPRPGELAGVEPGEGARGRDLEVGDHPELRRAGRRDAAAPQQDEGTVARLEHVNLFELDDAVGKRQLEIEAALDERRLQLRTSGGSPAHVEDAPVAVLGQAGVVSPAYLQRGPKDQLTAGGRRDSVRHATGPRSRRDNRALRGVRCPAAPRASRRSRSPGCPTARRAAGPAACSSRRAARLRRGTTRTGRPRTTTPLAAPRGAAASRCATEVGASRTSRRCRARAAARRRPAGAATHSAGRRSPRSGRGATGAARPVNRVRRAASQQAEREQSAQ